MTPLPRAEVLVVGAGPAGLMASITTARAGVSVFLAEGGPIGGHLNKRSTVISDAYPDATSGYALSLALQLEAEDEGVTLVPDMVVGAHRFGQWTTIELGTGGRIEARWIVIATGRGPGLPPIGAVQMWAGRGVTDCASCDGGFARGGPIVGLISGPVALQEAVAARSFTDRLIYVMTGWQPESTADHEHLSLADELFEGDVAEIFGTAKVSGVELVDGTAIEAALIIAKDEGIPYRPAFLERTNVESAVIGHARSPGTPIDILLTESATAVCALLGS